MVGGVGMGMGAGMGVGVGRLSSVNNSDINYFDQYESLFLSLSFRFVYLFSLPSLTYYKNYRGKNGK